MRNDSDKKNLILVDDTPAQGFIRLLPTIIVLSVVGGFFALSWYAYHAGIDSVKDEDLLVVEADKTPMKEKPADPGGMQFPNQDKTIFDTFNGNKPPAKNVERILPSPEEPMSKDIDTSDTSTWINNKLTEKPDIAIKEQVIGKKEEKVKTTETLPIAATGDDESESFVATRDNTKADQALTEAVKPADNEKTAADQAAATKLQKEQAAKEAAAKADKEQAAASAKAAEDKKAKEQAAKEAAEKAKAEKTVASATGNTAIQLGAYRSEQEASDAWSKMHTKFKELSDKKPATIRADLGSKGIYYRLRVNSLDAAGAKNICQSLSAKGQACIIAQGN